MMYGTSTVPDDPPTRSTTMTADSSDSGGARYRARELDHSGTRARPTTPDDGQDRRVVGSQNRAAGRIAQRQVEVVLLESPALRIGTVNDAQQSPAPKVSVPEVA